MTTTSTSLSTSVYSIVKSLLAAEPKWLGMDRIWSASNSDQTRFLEALNRCYADQVGLSQIEDTIASNNQEEIETWTQTHKVKLAVPEIDPNSEIWVGSTLEITPSWEKPGRASQRTINGKLYHFVTMREGFSYYAPPSEMTTPISPESTAPVNFCVRIGCAEGDSLWFMMISETPQSPLDIVEMVHNIQKNRCADSEPCVKPRLHFPMVKLEHEMNSDWLAGLSTEDDDGTNWTITGGIQKHILNLDEKGTPVTGGLNSGFYMTGGGNRKEQPTEMIFDMPFLVWTEHKGTRDSIFSAYITPENWIEMA